MSDAPRFVYSLSSVKNLVSKALRSIRTLCLHGVDPSRIIVYFTPPRDDSDRQRLSQLGVELRERPNRTDAFAIKPRDENSHYGDKAWVGEVEADRVLFLDCDTLILGDPRSLFTGDEPIRARPSPYTFDEDDWASMFDRHGEPVHPWMPNTGVLVFQEGFHRQIADDWVNYIAADLQSGIDMNLADQVALALAIADYRTGKLTPREHVMVWEGESPPDGIIYHIGREVSVWTPPVTVRGNLYHAVQAFLDKF